MVKIIIKVKGKEWLIIGIKLLILISNMIRKKSQIFIVIAKINKY